MDSNARLSKSLLWKIEAPGASKPSYLFGTMHIIDADQYFLPKGTLTAIDACKKMVFEIDSKEMEDVSSLMGMMNKLMMKDNKTIKDLVSDDDYQLVEQHFKKLGIPLFFFERMQPLLLSMFADESMSPTMMQDGTMKSYEMEFSELAKEKKMLTGGLESMELQVSIIDSIPYQDQAALLIDAIKSSGKEEDSSMQKMSQSYTTQDVDALAAYIDSETQGNQDFSQKLLVNRNKQWIKPIIDMSVAMPTFFAVGAGHLGGPQGVIRLLQARGIKVTAVKQ
jgi:uncharacterized protein